MFPTQAYYIVKTQQAARWAAAASAPPVQLVGASSATVGSSTTGPGTEAVAVVFAPTDDVLSMAQLTNAWLPPMHGVPAARDVCISISGREQQLRVWDCRSGDCVSSRSLRALAASSGVPAAVGSGVGVVEMSDRFLLRAQVRPLVYAPL